MSGQGHDWSDWGALWREQATVDVARLQRQVAGKRRRMRLTVVLELLASMIAIGQCLRLAFHTTGRWQWWSVASLLLVLMLQWLYLNQRRGTWQASGSDVRSSLRLSRRRALAGARLASINLWGMLVLVLATMAIAAPDLAPARWAADPHLKFVLGLQLAVNGPLVLAGVGGCLWYRRRQRARLARVDAELAAYEDTAQAYRSD